MDCISMSSFDSDTNPVIERTIVVIIRLVHKVIRDTFRF